jgi:hypothetical protein
MLPLQTEKRKQYFAVCLIFGEETIGSYPFENG